MEELDVAPLETVAILFHRGRELTVVFDAEDDDYTLIDTSPVDLADCVVVRVDS